MGTVPSQKPEPRASSFGVVFPANADPRDLASFAVFAEHHGFDELWLVEDCFLSGGLTMAATALAVTERLRVGIGLLPAVLRNPGITAMEIATLANMYPGRFDVAFGHGVRSWMDQLGARTSNRLRLLEEVVVAVRQLLAGDCVTGVGTYVNLNQVQLASVPEIAPHVLIGSTGPKGLGLAGRVADGFLLAEGCGPQMLNWAQRQARPEGTNDQPPPRSVLYTWLAIEDDDQTARLALRPSVDQWLGSGHYPVPVRLAGVQDGLPAGPVPREFADEIAVAGDAVRCKLAVRRLVGAGVDTVVTNSAVADYREQYRRFATEVLERGRR
jgi:alkanesulfonate monooxygenase SsuD/methylene tetrahydromethanopterin reductase-like flavin-dependent oxidoreductase (luciferase family)